jgi:hypothetical protein
MQTKSLCCYEMLLCSELIHASIAQDASNTKLHVRIAIHTDVCAKLYRVHSINKLAVPYTFDKLGVQKIRIQADVYCTMRIRALS